MDALASILDIMSIPSARAPNRADPLIKARSLGKHFGEVVAVDDVSFEVERGRVLGLLGPNGAGKTTVVRMLTTLTSIGAGSASIVGHDVAENPEAVRRVIGLAGQAAAVDEKLSARENLELFARLYKLAKPRRRRRIAELIERFDMGEFAERPASTYSGGQRRRLDIVAALVAEPIALFLDEPTTGLDPRSRAEVWESVRSLAAEGTAIVLTTQYLDEADHLADEILMIDRGRTVACGTPEALKKTVGRDVLEIHVPRDADLATAKALLDTVDGVTVDVESRRVDLSITGGTRQSLDVLRSLDDNAVRISDFQLRRPTLDDAFLALTGEAAGGA
jgi:ABC-2 type transport system ATP-binding protein